MKTILLTLMLMMAVSVTAEAMKNRMMPRSHVHEFVGPSSHLFSPNGVRVDTFGRTDFFLDSH